MYEARRALHSLLVLKLDAVLDDAHDPRDGFARQAPLTRDLQQQLLFRELCMGVSAWTSPNSMLRIAYAFPD